MVIITIITINLDVFGSRGLHLNCYKGNNGPLLVAISASIASSLDKARRWAKRRNYGRMSIYITRGICYPGPSL